MYIERKSKLVLSAVDLDHIIDIDYFSQDKHMPPSLTFLELLVKESNLNGVDLNDIDIVEIRLDEY